MKIIKIGFDVPAWRHNLICYYCKTEVEVRANDLIYSGEKGDWAESGWESYRIECAACGTTISLDNDQVPELVKVKAQKRANRWKWFWNR